MAVWILAEKEAAPPWNLAPDINFDFLHCETEQPLGDVLIGTSGGGHAFIEVKISVRASTKANSALAVVSKQIVAQFVSGGSDATGSRPWERPLSADLDRFVLVTSSASPASVRVHLAKVLARLRDLSNVQKLDEVTSTVEERKIFSIFQDHIRRAWHETIGDHLTDSAMQSVLQFFWIQVLDVNDGGRDERQAKNLLRSSILEDPNDADSAWNTLLDACARFASLRSGGDRESLRRILNEKGVRTKAPPSYRADIDRLKRYSLSTLESLGNQRVSLIPLGDRLIKISRPSSQALRKASEEVSVVVVGEPGAGKSGALFDFVQSLLEEGRDVVFFTIDRIESGSLGALRQELGLEHEIVEVLRNWPADKRPTLILDALDAARSEGSPQTFHELLATTIRTISHWRVVTSIRKFDLRHNPNTQKLFAGRPPTPFQLSEFANVCHLNVPVLAVDEWIQVANQAPELAKLFTEASENLRTLLLIPFNLRLAAELIGGGVRIESLTPIETQIGLLELYWRERVIRTDDQGDAREALLTRVVTRMVDSRSLRMNRKDVRDAALSAPLKEILSSNVLSEWQPESSSSPDSSVLTFAHHVLFDYAVARLLLRGSTQSLVEYLGREPDIVLAIRPSLVMHFQYEWQRERKKFWDAVFRVIDSNKVPEIGKLIGPTVAVESARSVNDFALLISGLFGSDTHERELAEKSLRHITGALLVNAVKARLAGEVNTIWAEFLDRCTTEMRTNIAYSVRPVLLSICSDPTKMTSQQRHFTGIVARRLLAFALSLEPYDPMLVGGAIEAVSRTFESDAQASATALRQCLEPEHVANHGYEELFRLGHEIDRLIPLDPALVEDIYRATFTHYDPRQNATPLLASRILPLATTPQQEFDMARWVLSVKYELFLRGAPLHAFRALLVALRTYVTDHYYSRFGDRSEDRFDFDDRSAFVTSDFSEMWDEGTAHADDQPVRMLAAFQKYIEAVWSDAKKTNERQEILNTVISENRAASVWRRLLMSAVSLPNLARDLRPLAWAVPILMNDDTSRTAGDYLKSSFATFSRAERQKIEAAILSIATEPSEKLWSTPEETCKRLLGCLDFNSLVHDEAKAIRQAQEMPPNESVFKTSIISGVYTDEDYLRDRGVAVDEEQNRLLLQITEPVKIFGEKHRNEAPTLVQAEGALPSLRQLREALRVAETDHVPESEQNLAWGYLAEATRSLAEVAELSADSDVGQVAKELLLEAAKRPDPAPHPQIDAQFDRHPSWGSPASRIDTAHGLIRLSRQKALADDVVFNAIENLSKDPVPAVRYQIAINLVCLYEANHDLMWKLLEELSARDESRGVLQGMLVGALRRLAPYNPDRTTNCVLTIFNRIRDGDGATEVRRRSASIFAGLYLWQGQRDCGEMVTRFVEDPVEYNGECGQMIFDVRNWLNLGTVESSNPEKDAIRIGSFALLERMLRSILRLWKTLVAKYADDRSKPWSAEDQEEGRTLGRLAEAVCQHVYFMSGAHKDLPTDQVENISLAAAERARYLRESRTILELLSEFSFPSLVHYLLQMLEFFIPYDPPGVFLLIGRVVRSGKAGGYQYESMAVDLIVRLVERFIAEFRHVLREHEECRHTLVEVLDTFVDAGWPSARQLTYRMEEIFR
jgi:hypothetical protein